MARKRRTSTSFELPMEPGNVFVVPDSTRCQQAIYASLMTTGSRSWIRLMIYLLLFDSDLSLFQLVDLLSHHVHLLHLGIDYANTISSVVWSSVDSDFLRLCSDKVRAERPRCCIR